MLIQIKIKFTYILFLSDCTRKITSNIIVDTIVLTIELLITCFNIQSIYLGYIKGDSLIDKKGRENDYASIVKTTHIFHIFYFIIQISIKKCISLNKLHIII